MPLRVPAIPPRPMLASARVKIRERVLHMSASIRGAMFTFLYQERFYITWQHQPQPLPPHFRPLVFDLLKKNKLANIN